MAPIALAEVQGYVYDAKRRIARLARMRGDEAMGERLDREATELAARFEAAGQNRYVATGKLARFKHPKRIVFCDVLPKTALGKVQKTGLLALVSARAGAA